MDEPKKGRGRPAKPQAERKRHNQTFRVTDKVRERLKECADKNERSISEEVEVRIYRSFDAEDSAGGEDNVALLRMISANVALIERFMGATWVENDLVRTACREAVTQSFDMLTRPPMADGLNITAEEALTNARSRYYAHLLGESVAKWVADDLVFAMMKVMAKGAKGANAEQMSQEIDGLAARADLSAMEVYEMLQRAKTS